MNKSWRYAVVAVLAALATGAVNSQNRTPDAFLDEHLKTLRSAGIGYRPTGLLKKVERLDHLLVGKSVTLVRKDAFGFVTIPMKSYIREDGVAEANRVTSRYIIKDNILCLSSVCWGFYHGDGGSLVAYDYFEDHVWALGVLIEEGWGDLMRSSEWFGAHGLLKIR